jgi:hypothetical protein
MEGLLVNRSDPALRGFPVGSLRAPKSVPFLFDSQSQRQLSPSGSGPLWPGSGYTGFNCSSVAQNRSSFVFSIQYWVTCLAGEHRAPTMTPSASAILTRADLE